LFIFVGNKFIGENPVKRS